MTRSPRPPVPGFEPPSETACGVAPATRYGLPPEAFDRAWTVPDLQRYLQIGRTRAYALVNEPGFPPRLRTGRSHRWNGLQVLAWVHREDWRTVDQPRHPVAPPDSEPSPSSQATVLIPPRGLPAGRTSPPDARPPEVPHRGAAATPAIGPAGTAPVAPITSPVVRIIDPAQVQRDRAAARLAALIPAAATPSEDVGGSHPAARESA